MRQTHYECQLDETLVPRLLCHFHMLFFCYLVWSISASPNGIEFSYSIPADLCQFHVICARCTFLRTRTVDRVEIWDVGPFSFIYSSLLPDRSPIGYNSPVSFTTYPAEISQPPSA